MFFTPLGLSPLVRRSNLHHLGAQIHALVHPLVQDTWYTTHVLVDNVDIFEKMMRKKRFKKKTCVFCTKCGKCLAGKFQGCRMCEVGSRYCRNSISHTSWKEDRCQICGWKQLSISCAAYPHNKHRWAKGCRILQSHPGNASL